MATEYTVPQILQIAKICEYLSGNEANKAIAFKSNFTDVELAKVIYVERSPIQYRYNVNPSDTTLPLAANYLFALLGKYSAQAIAILNGLTQSPPQITNPANVSTSVGGAAVFTVSVTSSIAFTIQWYKSGVAIPGAITNTLILTNVQLADSGSTYFAKATNVAGQATSGPATLTVIALITAFAYYSDTDPFPNLSINLDNFTYQISQNISNGAPITITWPSAAANNQYELLKVPVGQPIKSVWFNTALNNGTIPDAIYRPVITFGGFNYYCSRVAMSLDGTTLTETYS